MPPSPRVSRGAPTASYPPHDGGDRLGGAEAQAGPCNKGTFESITRFFKRFILNEDKKLAFNFNLAVLSLSPLHHGTAPSYGSNASSSSTRRSSLRFGGGGAWRCKPTLSFESTTRFQTLMVHMITVLST